MIWPQWNLLFSYPSEKSLDTCAPYLFSLSLSNFLLHYLQVTEFIQFPKWYEAYENKEWSREIIQNMVFPTVLPTVEAHNRLPVFHFGSCDQERNLEWLKHSVLLSNCFSIVKASEIKYTYNIISPPMVCFLVWYFLSSLQIGITSPPFPCFWMVKWMEPIMFGDTYFQCHQSWLAPSIYMPESF